MTKMSNAKIDKFKERKEAREAAMTLLYSLGYTPDTVEYQIECFMEEEHVKNFSKKALDYIMDVARGTLDKLPEVDEFIKKYCQDWSFDRIAPVDVAVLRLAIYEMLYRKDIPRTVSINEAVNIAKKYGHDDSQNFVNGVLGSIYKELEEVKE